MKRAYLVTGDEDSDYPTVAVVAESSGKAKMIAMSYFEDVDYVDLRIKVRNDIDVSAFEVGEMDVYKALELGLYGWLSEGDCPECHAESTYIQYDNGFSCSDCREQEK